MYVVSSKMTLATAVTEVNLFYILGSIVKSVVYGIMEFNYHYVTFLFVYTSVS